MPLIASATYETDCGFLKASVETIFGTLIPWSAPYLFTVTTRLRLQI